MNGREALFEVARSEGARCLFANPGTTELPLFDEFAADIGATVVNLNNGGYQILKSQLLGLGKKTAAAEVYPGMDIAGPAVDFMALAKAFGVPAERPEKADDVTAAVRAGIARGGPSVIEVPLDATVRPLSG